MAKKAEANTYITEAEMEQASVDTGKKLAAEPKVSIMITPDPKEKFFECSINGYGYRFPRGEVVEVPKSVAALISDLAQDVKMSQEYSSTLVKGLVL